jgi:hypothetical protein
MRAGRSVHAVIACVLVLAVPADAASRDPVGAPRANSVALTQSVPAMPTDLTATAVSATKVRLRWTDNANDETGFEVSNGVETHSLAANGAGYDWGGLRPGTSMCFKLRAVNAAGPSPWYPDVPPFVVCATTFRAPAAPRWIGLTTPDKTTFGLRWLDRADNEAGFEIFDDRGRQIRAPARPGTGPTEVDWPGHTPDESRCFRIRAMNAVASAWTAWACARIPAADGSTAGRFACSTGASCETERAVANLAFAPVRALSRRRATVRAAHALERLLGGMDANGGNHRITCRRAVRSAFRCLARWRDGPWRYRTRIAVSADGLVRVVVMRRSGRRSG